MDVGLIKLTAVGSAGSALLGAASQLSADTMVPLGAIVGVIVAVSIGTWKIATLISNYRSRLEDAERRLSNLDGGYQRPGGQPKANRQ
jgi:hypothetical protein